MTETEFMEKVRGFFSKESAKEQEITELDLTGDLLDTVRLTAVSMSSMSSIPDTMWADLDTCDLLFSTKRGKLWCRTRDLPCLLDSSSLIAHLLKDF